MTVRSSRLGARTSSPASSVHLVVTPDGGQTVILKDVRLSFVSGTVTRCVVFTSSGATDVSLFDDPLPANSTVGFECWVVLLPGDDLNVYSEGGVVAIWASGAILDGIAL